MFKIKASSAPFGFSSNNTNFYFTNKDAELSQILEELLNCITDISHFVEAMPYLEKYKSRLLLSRLDQASGLCLSVSTTVENIETILNQLNFSS